VQRGINLAGSKQDSSHDVDGSCNLVPTGRPGFDCWWFDQTTAGYVTGVGYASSLADAAAKTSQIRASVEH